MRYLLLIISLITIGFTTLVSIPGSPYLIGGHTQADISNIYATSVTPAGITFTIWSLIYLSWIIMAVYVACFYKKKSLTSSKHHGVISERSLEIYSLAIGLTGVWLIPWGNLYIGTALVIMVAILALVTYVFTLTRDASLLVRSSIELTLGWILIATTANISVYLRYLGLPYAQPGDYYYAIFALGALLLIVSELQCRYKTYIISAVFLWTLLGEWIAHPLLEARVAVVIYALTLSIYIWNSFYGRSTSLKNMKFWE